MLILEGAQAGLSWVTILQSARRTGRRSTASTRASRPLRREEVRGAARRPGHRAQPAQDPRHGKNARAFLDVQEEFGSFDAYIWGFVGGTPIVNRRGRWARSREDAGIRRDQQGPEAARIQVRRLDHLLRVHAGHGHGERPPRGLPEPEGRRSRENKETGLTEHIDPRVPQGGLSQLRSATDTALSDSTVHALLATAARRWPERDAAVFVDQGLRLRWREFRAEVEAAAAGLKALGLRRATASASGRRTAPNGC